MQTEQERVRVMIGEDVDPDVESRERELQWLLEMDLSEPEERLFTVVGNEYLDTGLSAFEAEVAARPLVRGNAAGDDLASYVEEEIVISSAGDGAEIYGRNDGATVSETAPDRRDEIMAIDFSRARHQPGGEPVVAVDDGIDILGLSGEDDIGDRFVSIRRVKPEVSESVQSPPAGETVRDEAPQEVGDAEETRAVDGGTNLLDYVAAAPLSADDEVFDEYLLAGGHLRDDGADPEELVVRRAEGVIAVDAVSPVTIDYHEDFQLVEEGAAAARAAVVATVREAVNCAVCSHLAAMGLDANAVLVEVRSATDAEAVEQCHALGFEPLHAVCVDLPLSLLAVAKEERESIFLRLRRSVDNGNWNDLFRADSSVAGTGEMAPADDPAGPSQPALDLPVEASATQPGDPLVEDGSAAGFGEDIFAEDIFSGIPGDDAAAQPWQREDPFGADIEAAFAELQPVWEVDDSAQDPAVDAPHLPFDVAPDALDFEQVAEHTAPVSRDEPVVIASDGVPSSDAARVASTSDNNEHIELAAFDGTRLDGFIPEYIEFNYASQSNAEIFTDFLDAFIEEGSAEVEKLEHEVGEWEKQVASESLFACVSRTLHTLKGIAKGVGLHRLGTLVHNFETLLEKMPRPVAGEEQGYFRIVNAWLDAVVRGVEHVAAAREDVASELPVQGRGDDSGQRDAGAVPPAPVAAGVAAGPAVDSAVVGAPEDAPVDAVDPAREATRNRPELAALSALEKKRDQQLADEGAKVLAAQQSVRITSEKLDHLLNLASHAQQLGVRASQNTTRSKRSSAELQARLSSVRTHIRQIADRALLHVNARPGSVNPDLDALEMDQYSELQEAANILREGVEDLADLVDVVSRQNLAIETLLKQQSSVISSFSSSIQGARVVPVSRLMPGLRRIVRTVSTDLGKVVAFRVLNETGALDRDHYARLQVVLEHMVRNALDHGIETPDERLATGKPTGGCITIDVRKTGVDYLIRLSDDGRGIDPDAIRLSAHAKGLDVDVEGLSDDEAIRLIFHKGFSTASTLSEISGRGVGMDIVLTELQQIGGDVRIQSTVGQGTTFEVRIPSNVSVNGALLVAAASESYAIPLNGLIAVDQVCGDEFFAAVAAGSTLSLGEAACEPTYLATLCQGVALPDRGNWGKFVPVIIAGTDERRMAIAIDNLEEALELVVRSLGTQFSSVPGLAGAATTAEGEAIVALDLNLLVSSAGADGLAPVAVSQDQHRTLLALVVDDSRTQRMVATSQLETVGVETVTAENGMVAIDLLNASRKLPDVVLLDVEMPVKDGIQTLREIRKSRRYGHLPVIMVTSRTGAKHRALAAEAGCSAYMGKPFNFPELIGRINELTGHDLQLS